MDRLFSRRNFALIALFLDIDRRVLLTTLRALPRAERKRAFCGLLINATRW